jgi:hypothetical protein
VLSSSFKAQLGDIVVYLRSASRQLIRWLCALLAPGLGWIVKGPLAPWTAHYDETAQFVIATDVHFDFLDNERSPMLESEVLKKKITCIRVLLMNKGAYYLQVYIDKYHM